MKFRQGFVSNSSSASFIIEKNLLTKLQISLIKNHIREAPKYGIMDANEGDAWCIAESRDTISGYTYMDNFNMETFLRKIGVDLDLANYQND